MKAAYIKILLMSKNHFKTEQEKNIREKAKYIEERS